MADTPAVKALKDEIEAVRKNQQPTRDQIAELEASLSEGEGIIARNEAAIAILSGEVGIGTAPRQRARRSSNGASTPASQIDESRIVTFLGANPDSGARAIADGLGINTGNPLTTKLGQLVSDGKLTRKGERRATTYAVKNG